MESSHPLTPSPRAETREQLARYDGTGEYIADEDMQAWLRTQGTPSEQRPSTRVRCPQRADAVKTLLGVPPQFAISPTAGLPRPKERGGGGSRRRTRVTILEYGFEYAGGRYGSLSATARAATGTPWKGLLFFRLAASPPLLTM
jgi:hypothetical protein